MKEVYNNNSLAENKVLILYTLKRIDRDLTNNDLFKIVSEINGINYFYFSDILHDLINSDLVGTYPKEEKIEIFKLTSKGEESLELTIDILPGILKLKADTLFEREMQDIAEKQSICAEYIPENENDYTVKCKIVDHNKTIFEVVTFAGSNEQAKKISKNWEENADVIYPKIIELLNSDK